MNFFYIINGKKLKRNLIIIVALLFAAGIIYTEKGNITVFTQQKNPSAIYSVDTTKKEIALTFDISWGDKKPEPIIKILKDKGVNATFFLSSPWSRNHPDLVREIAMDGFEIGSHGHKHVNYSGLSDTEIRNQIATAHRILTDLTGRAPTLIRLPNGDFDKRVLNIAQSLHYQVIQWDTDSLDWMNKGVDNIINRVLTKAHPGDIVLLHASDSVKQTHLALPVIIDKLKQKGYKFVTVGELLHQTKIERKQVEDKATTSMQASSAY